MPRITLNQVNKAIAAKFPGVELVKGEGYFYVAPTDYNSDMAQKIAALYQQGIYGGTSHINCMSLEKWIEAIEFTLQDKYQTSEYMREPAI